MEQWARRPKTAQALAQRARIGVRRLLVGGLATDYCVRWTVEDALAKGYEAVVLLDAVRAVDVQPGDGACALRVVRRRGAATAGAVGGRRVTRVRRGSAQSREGSAG